MNLFEMLEQLGFDPDLLLEDDDGKLEDVLSQEVQVHQQQNYPLRGNLANARILDGQVVLASGTATEYGSQDAWEDAWED